MKVENMRAFPLFFWGGRSTGWVEVKNLDQEIVGENFVPHLKVGHLWIIFKIYLCQILWGILAAKNLAMHRHLRRLSRFVNTPEACRSKYFLHLSRASKWVRNKGENSTKSTLWQNPTLNSPHRNNVNLLCDDLVGLLDILHLSSAKVHLPILKELGVAFNEV